MDEPDAVTTDNPISGGDTEQVDDHDIGVAAWLRDCVASSSEAACASGVRSHAAVKPFSRIPCLIWLEHHC